MPDDFDPTTLARLPRLELQEALALSLRLIEATPHAAPVAVRCAVEALREARAELAGRALGLLRKERGAELRWPDGDVVLAWRALHGRLESCTHLPADRYPVAVRAATLLASLFPTGLDFVREAGEGRTGELRRRYQRLSDEALRRELEQVAGTEFVDEVGRVMAIERGRPTLSMVRPGAAVPDGLSGSLAMLHRSMSAYLLQLCTMYDEGNAQARMAVRVALGPVTQLGRGVDGAARPAAARPPRRLPGEASLAAQTAG